MTIRTAVLAGLAAVAVPLLAAAPPQDDVVVRARKLREWRAVLVAGKDDALGCRIVRSTGDAALDAMACAAKEACYRTARPRILAATAASASTRKRLMAGINRDLEACFGQVSVRFSAYPLDDPAAPDTVPGDDPENASSDPGR